MESDELLAALARIGAGPLPDADTVRYATDATDNYHGVPLAVMRPRNVGEVSEIVRVCAETGTSLVPHGGNSGLVGGAVPIGDDASVVVSLESMRTVRDLDLASNTVTIEAGLLLVELQELAADNNRLFPLRHAGLSSQMGGNLSTNAGGTNVIRYGMTRNLVLGVEVVLADGTIWNGLNRLPKDNTGYDLKHLFLGAEGTLGIITAAKVRLFPAPKITTTAWIGTPSAARAIDLLQRCRSELDEVLSTFELMNRTSVDYHLKGRASPLPDHHEWYILAEFATTSERLPIEDILLEIFARASNDGVIGDAVIAQNATQVRSLWSIREGIPTVLIEESSCIKGDTGVPISAIPAFLAAADTGVRAIVSDAQIVTFGHVGDGNIHYNVVRPDAMPAQEFAHHGPALTAVIEEAALALGGTLSAEHGLGQKKAQRITEVLSNEELDLMRVIKRALDPQGIMNPGKIITTDERAF
jgi:FAD/FMN-containing dehydrogenase